MDTAALAKGRQVKFQTRLLVRYSLLVLILIVVLSISFYAYTSRLFEDNAAGTYRLLSSRMSLHLDNLIRPMDFITENLISDYNFRTALTTLATFNRNDQRNDALLNEAAQTITGSLLTYAIQKNFYSVVVVSKDGEFFSSNFVNHAQVNSETKPLGGIPGYDAAKKARGRPVLVPPHDDPWNPQAHMRVYGLARVVPGLDGNLALMVVQNPVRDLDTLFHVPDQDYVRIFAFQRDGSPFYENRPTRPELVSHYLELAKGPQGGRSFQRDPVTGRSELVISARSDYTGVRIVLVLSRDVLLRPLAFVGWATVGVSLLIILFSVAYNWISSAQLSKPLRLIRHRMEATELSNLPGHDAIEHENDEIVALDQAFQRLRKRLDEAITRELDSRTLSLQSRLDSLQAQVNPHFLYNILTVIAGKGLELGNEEIGEICDAIATMLRYSTSTAVRSATIAEELDHTRSYLFLMKKRFEDRLHFEFAVDPAMEQVTVPKIVLQQIVENCINHAFRDLPGPLEVTVSGTLSQRRWRVEVSDNGCGFDTGVLEEIRQKTEEFRTQAAGRNGSSGLAIGGLGLLNTYVRLHLFFKGEFDWHIGNRPEGGARVVIGAPATSSVRGKRNVHGSSRRG